MRSATAASWPQGMQAIPAPEKVPDTLDWDLWLGGAAWRPYTSGDDAYRKTYDQQFGFYLPFNWRGFFDFGSSLIGDWGIHILGPANLALRLGSPTSVECTRLGEGEGPYTFPFGGAAIKWEFGARENMPPVTVYWSDTGDLYTPPGMTVDEMRQIPNTGPVIAAAPGGGGRGRGGGARGGAVPEAAAAGRAGRGGTQGGQPQGSGYNQVFVGSKGYLGTSGRGEGVGLIPGARWAEYKLPPQLLTRSPGHQRDWIRACKGGEPACSNFSIAGPYTEWMVLGAIAARVPGKLLWDAKKMEFTNNKDASGSTTNWPPPAYSPDTGLFYVPENNSYAIAYLIDPDPRGSMGLGGRQAAGVGSVGSFLTAIDARTAKVAWRHLLPGGASGILATAGRLLFAGDGGGNIVAFDDATGKPLWHSRIGAVSNAPETYMLDGRQYLLTAAGDTLYAFTLY